MLSPIRNGSEPEHEIQRCHPKQQNDGNQRGAPVPGPDAGCEHHDTDDGAERRHRDRQFATARGSPGRILRTTNALIATHV